MLSFVPYVSFFTYLLPDYEDILMFLELGFQ